MAAIFLSHASANDALSSAMLAWLRRHGFDDVFCDHSSIRSGDKWADELRRAKSSCRVVIFLVTEHWLASDECFAEYQAAWYMGRRLVPLMALRAPPADPKHAERLRRVLQEDQGADITAAGAPDTLDLDSKPDLAEPIMSGLRAAGALAKVGFDPTAFEVDRAARPEPYPGLESFGDTDADAAIFPGRSPEIAQCLEDLREMRASGERRAYAIVGASGSGKSSLMKAGVLPRLRREKSWLALRSFRPGGDPLLGFADAIARSAADLSISLASGAVRDRLLAAYRAKGDLRAALNAELAPLRAKADRAAATVLVPIDQAEELAQDEGESTLALSAFLKAALGANGDDQTLPYLIALTVRSDSFAALQSSKALEDIGLRSAEVRTLPVWRFDAAVEMPAQRYGVEIEPALVEALMQDAGGKSALPLLAFTLQRLWRQYNAEGRIKKSNYEAVGALSGLIGDAAERALRVINPFAPPGPLEGRVTDRMDREASRAFLPALAQVDEQGKAIKRSARIGDFEEPSVALLESFKNWRLVVGAGDTVEVAHEALFREWPRFTRWFEPERRRLESLRSLENAATVWRSSGRAWDDLTHVGTRLSEARKLAKAGDFRTLIGRSPDVARYLAACVRKTRGWRITGLVLAMIAALLVGSAVVLSIVGLVFGATPIDYGFPTIQYGLVIGLLSGAMFGLGTAARNISARAGVQLDWLAIILSVAGAVAAGAVVTIGLLARPETLSTQTALLEGADTAKVTLLNAINEGVTVGVTMLGAGWLALQAVLLVVAGLVSLFRGKKSR